MIVSILAWFVCSAESAKSRYHDSAKDGTKVADTRIRLHVLKTAAKQQS